VTTTILAFLSGIVGAVFALVLHRDIRVDAGQRGLLRMVSFAVRLPPIVTALFVLGALLLDFQPLAIYRYLLVSDLLVVAAWAVQLVLDRRIVVYLPAVLMVAFGLQLAGMLIASGGGRSVVGLNTSLHFLFSMLVITPTVTTLLVRRPDLRLWLVGAVVATACIQAVIIEFQVLNGLEWRSGSRISGALGSSGLWIYAAAVVAIVGFLTARASRRWLVNAGAVAILAVTITAELLLRSRMLWIVSVLGASLMLVLQSRRRFVGLTAAASVWALPFAAYASGLLPGAIEQRITDALRPAEASDLAARLEVVRELIPAIEQTRGVGIGLGQSEAYLREQHSPAVVVAIHNVVLHAAVEGGMLAAAGVLMLPVAIFALWRAASHRVQGPADRFTLNWEVATLIATFIGAQLTPTLYEHTFYVLLGALSATAAGSTCDRLRTSEMPRIVSTWRARDMSSHA